MSRFAQDLFQQTHALTQSGEDFVLVTWVQSEGHTPQDVGAKAIVRRQGLHWGSVGGGKVEARAIAFAQSLLNERADSKMQTPHLIRWDLQRDIGMSCGGVIHILFETFLAQPWPIVIFGAGHVAQALVRALGLLDCHVTCVDTRLDWLERLPKPSEQAALRLVHTTDMAAFASDVPPGTYCILVTKGHDSDVPILKQLLRKPNLAYLGVIGSKVKSRALKAELQRDGFSADDVRRFQCPMGIPLGCHQPAEIAMSIIAQLIMIKNKVTSMKELAAGVPRREG